MITDSDRALLEFESDHPALGAVKDHLVSLRFGMRPARYYQVLNRLTWDVGAEAEFPMLVHRLRRKTDLGGIRTGAAD